MQHAKCSSIAELSLIYIRLYKVQVACLGELIGVELHMRKPKASLTGNLIHVG